jgi:acylphosphatase
VTRRFLVTGRVQGVGFRWFVARLAQREALGGFVRNLPDGRVEVLASGEEVALERLLAALREGPPHAQVAGVSVSDDPAATSSARFEIR